MNVQEAVNSQLGFWHGTMEQVIADCDDELLHKQLPGATCNSIAAIYAHAVISEDVIVHAMIRGAEPIYQSAGWEQKTGVPFPGVPPMQTPEWAAKIKMKLPEFQAYAKDVYAATEAYLSSAPDSDMEQKRQSPFGEQTVGFLVAALLGTHVPQHAGEVAALKGVSGLKGLPF
jgi:hypothetical protein